ncbi:EmrB/QacA family drug resistance transporter [Microtetraspora sp. NBRC 13810]|nr:EmrB/QacA family drug resistance transporter [Microtetraspora sp. NBRC 13810]
MLVLSALVAGLVLAALSQLVVAAALPTMAGDLGGLRHLSWVVTAYMLTATAGAPLWFRLRGRHASKTLLVAAITVFLAGSLLAGLSETMGQLVGSRAIQGLGGGGMIVLAQAAAEEVVPARHRGRCQRVLGVVFGVASVAGVLLGGFPAEHGGWRWLFYLNLPVGVAVLAVVAAAPRRGERVAASRTGIDYLGALLLFAAATTLVLLESLDGFGAAPMIAGLLAVTAALLTAWVITERRAAEPILPLHLFAVPAFALCSAIGFAAGFALFGSIVFIPMFLQVVHDTGAGASGLFLWPAVAGLLAGSAVSGRLVERTGRSRTFPVAGAGLTAVALYLLSKMGPETSLPVMGLFFLLIGLGLGMVTQVLVTTVQNAVGYCDLGTATAGTAFFRNLGGACGAAVFGSIFTDRLGADVARVLHTADLPPAVSAVARGDPTALDRLPPDVRTELVAAYSDAITAAFVWAVPIVVLAFVLALLLKKTPLHDTARVPDYGEGLGCVPTQRTCDAEAERMLSVLVHDTPCTSDVYADLAARAGVDLPPDALPALCRVARASRVPAAAEHPAHVEHLVAAGLVQRVPGVFLELTEAGRCTAERLVNARAETLRGHVDHWSPQTHPALDALLHRLARDSLGIDPS